MIIIYVVLCFIALKLVGVGTLLAIPLAVLATVVIPFLYAGLVFAWLALLAFCALAVVWCTEKVSNIISKFRK